MPIYEYACQACAHHFEKIQKFSDAPLIDCPACQKPKLEKLISASGFQLKGEGWFKTSSKSSDNAVCHPEPTTLGCGTCGKTQSHSH